MPDALTVAPGALTLLPAPAGLPAADLQPPIVAEPGDPFATARIVHLLARVERGRPIRIDDVAAALNAAHLDWAFSAPVVTAAIVQLQANWMADYRNASGIVLEAGPYGATVTVEESSRVDPWIVRQVDRQVAACREALAAFSRRDGAGFDD